MNKKQRINTKESEGFVEYSMTVDTGAFGEKNYKMHFSLCKDFENCDALHVSLIDTGNTVAHIAFHMKDRTLDKSIISQNIEKTLTEKDWELLAFVYDNIRSKVESDTKIKNRVIDFPMEKEIENSGTLVSYHEIFPYNDYPDEIFQIEVLGGIIFLTDCYCLRKNCNCQEAHIEFPILVDNVLKNSKTSILRVAYKTGKIEPTERLNNEDFSCFDLWKQFKEKYPEIEKILFNRHQKLKTLYENFKKKNKKTSKEINSKIEIGRNAPCPCGSGKKFKRCCDL
jgi:hypothetical protein